MISLLQSTPRSDRLHPHTQRSGSDLDIFARMFEMLCHACFCRDACICAGSATRLWSQWTWSARTAYPLLCHMVTLWRRNSIFMRQSMDVGVASPFARRTSSLHSLIDANVRAVDVVPIQHNTPQSTPLESSTATMVPTHKMSHTSFESLTSAYVM